MAVSRDTKNSLSAVPTFFTGLFEESMALAEEAHAYLDGEGREIGRSLPPTDAIVLVYEVNRLTTRVTHIMAWVLFRRAVQAGEISADEAAEDRCRLGDAATCLDRAPLAAARLPVRLEELMARSEALYRRIARLDELIANGNASRGPELPVI